jgi:hypothetical protein
MATRYFAKNGLSVEEETAGPNRGKTTQRSRNPGQLQKEITIEIHEGAHRRLSAWTVRLLPCQRWGGAAIVVRVDMAKPSADPPMSRLANLSRIREGLANPAYDYAHVEERALPESGLQEAVFDREERFVAKCMTATITEWTIMEDLQFIRRRRRYRRAIDCRTARKQTRFEMFRSSHGATGLRRCMKSTPVHKAESSGQECNNRFDPQSGGRTRCGGGERCHCGKRKIRKRQFESTIH